MNRDSRFSFCVQEPEKEKPRMRLAIVYGRYESKREEKGEDDGSVA
jgi:hypothetical protein